MTVEATNRHKVFISHSSADKEFVRSLIADLKTHDLNVWFDEADIKPGDSIVNKISDGIKEADYLIVVLSTASIQSDWVNAELNSALMEQLSNKGGLVIPILIEDVEVPVLLRDRKYADFRKDYDQGLIELLRVFTQESETSVSLSPLLQQTQSNNKCILELSKLSLADLRRLITQKMSRDEVNVLWFDIFETTMNDDMEGRKKSECVVELISRSKDRQVLDLLIENICMERSDIARP